MSTLTNFNVKVPIDIPNFPVTDQSVIWDTSAGAFALGTIGSSGITVKSDPATIEVTNATTLTFTNGKVTSGVAGEAVVDSLWFTAANYNWGGQTGIASSAGFRLDGSDAYTHVTPQRFNGKILLLATPDIDGDGLPDAYPNNYIVYTSVSVDPGEPGGGGTDGSSGGDPTTWCGKNWGSWDANTLTEGDSVT